MEETGCQQVNIIAHSKGGLDARAAIAHCGMASCVATLTTINTPHRGCVFAEYLLNHLPDRMVRRSQIPITPQPGIWGMRSRISWRRCRI